MSLSTLFTALVLAALALLLVAAVVSDLRSRRIPNRLVLHGIVFAAAWHLALLAIGLPALAGERAYAPLAGLVVGGLVLMPLYLLGACGAGDVKLMAMVGAFLGPGAVLWAALCTLVAGGVLSLVVMLGRGIASQTLRNLHFMLQQWVQRVTTGGAVRLEPLRTSAFHLPYAVAIAIGTLSAVLLAPPWTA